MGFLDKLKDVAKTATDKVASLQAEKERKTAIQALEKYGSIEGANIPDNAGYFLDDENDRIVVCTSDKSYVCEYNYDNVVDFKFMESTQNRYDWWTTTWCDMKLTTLSGEELLLSQSFMIYDEKDEPKARLELKDRIKLRFLILTFALAMKDEQTKEWANSIYQEDGLLPIFDENGEFSSSNVEKNIETVKKG